MVQPDALQDALDYVKDLRKFAQELAGDGYTLTTHIINPGLHIHQTMLRSAAEPVTVYYPAEYQEGHNIQALGYRVDYKELNENASLYVGLAAPMSGPEPIFVIQIDHGADTENETYFLEAPDNLTYMQGDDRVFLFRSKDPSVLREHSIIINKLQQTGLLYVEKTVELLESSLKK